MDARFNKRERTSPYPGAPRHAVLVAAQPHRVDRELAGGARVVPQRRVEPELEPLGVDVGRECLYPGGESVRVGDDVAADPAWRLPAVIQRHWGREGKRLDGVRMRARARAR